MTPALGAADGPGRLGVADAEAEARLLSRVVETISAGLDLDRILQGVAQLVTETTETDVCFVHLLDERGRKLQLRGATPPFDTMVGSVELALGEGVAGWVADHGQPAVIVDNKAADPRYRYIPALRGEEFTSMLSVPVVTPMGHLVGVLNVHTRAAPRIHRRRCGTAPHGGGPGGRGDRERPAAPPAGRARGGTGAVRRADGGMAGRRAAADGRGDPRRHQPAHRQPVLPPVRRGRRDPGFTRQIAAEQVARAQELAAAALDETRSAIAGLRPPVLDDLGLAASLESLGHSFPTLDVRVDADPALHGRARRRPRCTGPRRKRCRTRPSTPSARSVQIRLYRQKDRAVLEVTDDGSGFDTGEVPAGGTRGGPTGFGLSGMRERAELLGGHLDLASAPGHGTTVRLAIPYLPAAQSHPG